MNAMETHALSSGKVNTKIDIVVAPSIHAHVVALTITALTFSIEVHSIVFFHLNNKSKTLGLACYRAKTASMLKLYSPLHGI